MTKKFGVAVKAVVKFKDKFLILEKSSIEEVNPNTYDIPGGRIEFGEIPEDALKREVKEETGLDIQVIKPTRTWSFVKDEMHIVGITFLCIATSNSVKLSFEHTNAFWLDEKEVNTQTNIPSWIKDEINATNNL